MLWTGTFVPPRPPTRSSAASLEAQNPWTTGNYYGDAAINSEKSRNAGRRLPQLGCAAQDIRESGDVPKNQGRLLRREAIRAACVSAIGGLLISNASGAADWQQRVSTDLVRLYGSSTTNKIESVSPAPTESAVYAPNAPRFDSKGRVQVDVYFDCALPTRSVALKAVGFLINTSIKVTPLCVTEGWVAPEALPNVVAIAGVLKVKTPSYNSRTLPKEPAAQQNPSSSPLAQSNRAVPQALSGTVIDGNGVTIMHADAFVSQTGTNGSGVIIGVMSDDATSLAVIQARGELPSVTVVTPPGGGSAPATPTDEGTMMLEEVHAVAPGATLLFCGPQTSTDYVGCLGNLIAAGATILVDDLTYSDEDLMSLNGEFAQAVQSTMSANPNVALFTVTENYNNSYWEGSYTPQSLVSTGHGPITCLASGQTDYFVNSFSGTLGEALTVYAAGDYFVTFQWADPYDQNSSNFDVYWYNTTTATAGCVSAVGSTATHFGPSQYLDAGTYDLYVMTPDASLSGKFLKLWIDGDGDTELSTPTPGSIVSPQAFVNGVNTVGAVNGADGVGNSIESYSGRGPINLVFPTPSQIQAPSFVAPDNVYVDAIGTHFPSASYGTFQGTSAAAPNAAALAALLRGAFPGMTPSQLANALQKGATQLGSSVPDGTFGYGRVDALGALGVYPGPSLTSWGNSSVVGGSSTSATPITVNGFGTLHFSVTSSNPSLIPASLVAARAAGITLTPANCGSGSTACAVSATPAIGQVGSATVTVTAKDGANRAATTTTTITVTKPPPPTISITSGATQAVSVNASIAPAVFEVQGARPLTVTSVTTGLSSTSVPYNCNNTTLSCTASLGVAPSAAGTDTVTFTVSDGYGQSASASASITVTAPATHGGGGGAVADWEVIVLSSLVFLQGARRVRNGARRTH